MDNSQVEDVEEVVISDDDENLHQEYLGLIADDDYYFNSINDDGIKSEDGNDGIKSKDGDDGIKSKDGDDGIKSKDGDDEELETKAQDPLSLMCATWKLQEKMEESVDREIDAFAAKHMPGLLDVIELYVKETNPESLNLSSLGLQTEQLKSILTFLQGSQVTDLDLSDNSFERGMKTLSKLFAQTKLNKVNLRDCELTSKDVCHLMQILKSTQITHLDLSDNDIELSVNKVEKFVPWFQESHLTVLNMRASEFLVESDFLSLFEALPSMSITDLNLSLCNLSDDSLTYLFSNLQHTSVTSLNLSENGITYTELQPICAFLKNSKLKELDISCNDLGDQGIDLGDQGVDLGDQGVNLLVENLPLSLVSLNLDDNNIVGKNNLSHYLPNLNNLSLRFNPIEDGKMFAFPDFLKDTTITILDLGSCDLGDELGQQLMESLKSSKIIKLNVSGNKLQLATVSKFAKIVEDTVIEDVDFSSNNLPEEAVKILGDALEKSVLKCIDLGQNFTELTASSVLSDLVSRTSKYRIKKNLVKSLKLYGNNVSANDARMIATCLTHSTLTHIDLSDNKIEGGVIYLAACLNSTLISHLNLANNDVDDDGAIALAESLEGCQVIDLNLNDNSITSRGAKALAFSLKKSSLLSLKLENNQIDNDGFESLAEQAENTYFNHFEGNYNPGCALILVEKVLWKNRISAHKLVSFFKLIAPETAESELLCFDRNKDGNVSTFLKACAQLYKTVMKQPSAISVLVEEENLQFTRKQIISLFKDNFPKQFIALVEKTIKPNATEFVMFLKAIREMGLTEILEPLLVDAPVVKIDENLSITHPLFYSLLSQFEQSCSSVTIDPQDKIKVIKYLSENLTLDGAADMIGILCDEIESESSKSKVLV